MKINANINIFLILLFGISAGLYFPFSNVFSSMLIIICISILGAYSLFLIVYKLFISKKSISIGLSGIISVILFLAIGLGLDSYFKNEKYKKAENIIYTIELYRDKNGFYPEDLTEIKVDSIDGLNYIINKDLESFNLEYNIDKTKIGLYKSNEKSWKTVKWHE